MVIIDTSLIIDHMRHITAALQKHSFLVRLAQIEPKENLAMSIVTVQELYEGQSMADPFIERLLLAIISPLTILPYTFDVAQKAGVIARDLHGAIELADAVIAATTILNGGELVTLNAKHFTAIKELELFDLKVL